MSNELLTSLLQHDLFLAFLLLPKVQNSTLLTGELKSVCLDYAETRSKVSNPGSGGAPDKSNRGGHLAVRTPQVNKPKSHPLKVFVNLRECLPENLSYARNFKRNTRKLYITGKLIKCKFQK